MQNKGLALVLGMILASVGGLLAWRATERAEAEPLPAAAAWRLDKIEALTQAAGFAAPAWSPDGGALAFTGGDGVYLYGFKDNSFKRLSSRKAGFKFFWTSDGDALVFRAQTPDKPLQIQRLDAATGRVTTLAQAADLGLPQETVAGLLQFRDGAKTRLLNAQTGATLRPETVNLRQPYVYQFRDEIYLQANGQTRQLTKSDGQYFLPQLSPDGQKVLYQELTRGICVTDLVTGVTMLLGSGEDPAWSPDSQFVAFAVTRDDGHQILASEICVSDLAGRRLQLTDTPARLETRPAWSPDGKFLAFDADGAIFRAAIFLNKE